MEKQSRPQFTQLGYTEINQRISRKHTTRPGLKPGMARIGVWVSVVRVRIVITKTLVLVRFVFGPFLGLGSVSGLILCTTL